MWDFHRFQATSAVTRRLHGRQLQQLTWTVNWQTYVYEQQMNDVTWHCRKSEPSLPSYVATSETFENFRELSKTFKDFLTCCTVRRLRCKRHWKANDNYDGWPGSREVRREELGSGAMLSPEATAQVVALRSSAEERSRFSSLLLNQSLAEIYHNSWTIAVYWCLTKLAWKISTLSALSVGVSGFDTTNKHFLTPRTPWGLQTWGFLQSLD